MAFDILLDGSGSPFNYEPNNVNQFSIYSAHLLG
jgi:hypothetical protein